MDCLAILVVTRLNLLLSEDLTLGPLSLMGNQERRRLLCRRLAVGMIALLHLISG